jgi:hypothetical protein
MFYMIKAIYYNSFGYFTTQSETSSSGIRLEYWNLQINSRMGVVFLLGRSII